MKRFVWPLLISAIVAAPAWAGDVTDARQALHEALEERAPSPVEPPSFPAPSRDTPTSPLPRSDSRSASAAAARNEASKHVGSAVRDAHVGAANRVAARSAREAVKNAQADVTGAPGQARSQEKRGVGNGKGNGNGNNGKGNNGNGNGNNGNGNNGNGNNGTKK